MKQYHILVLSFLSYITINAQETKLDSLKTTFSLQEAIDYALVNNRTSKNAELDIKAAKQQKWETTAIGLPQINGKVEYQNYLKSPLDALSQGDAADTGENPAAAGADFTQFLFPKHSLTPSATLSQLIFDGSYIVGLQSAKVFLDITKNAKIKTDQEITKSVTQAYNNVLLTEESIKLINKNIKSIEDNLSESGVMFENGLIEEEDIEQLQITLNNLYNNAESLDKMYLISIKMLKLTLGITNNQTITLTDNLNNLTTKTKEESSVFSNFSVANNIDYQIAENDVTSKKLLYKLEKAKLLPTISGFLTGSYMGISNEFTFFESDQNWIGTAIVGVNIDIPIFTSFSNVAKRKRAKFEWQKSQNTLLDTQEQIEINYQTVKSDLELAISTLDNKKQNLKLAERIENKNNIKYKEGIASSFDLRQAQIQLYTSQQEYLQAMVDVINKKAELNTLQN